MNHAVTDNRTNHQATRSTIARQRKQSEQATRDERRASDPNVDLMLRFQNGEEDAFRQLVENNINTVHALIYRFLREASMLDDITQDVFLRIYRNAHRYEPTAKFSTWLYRIVANLCFNVMRSRKKRRQISLDAMGDEESRHDLPEVHHTSVDQQLETEEMKQHLAEALSELPDNQRIAILLNKYEGKSYEEIAAILQTSTMAVKSLLSRARTNLRERLKRYVKHG